MVTEGAEDQRMQSGSYSSSNCIAGTGVVDCFDVLASAAP
jgi:hypothetical protein